MTESTELQSQFAVDRSGSDGQIVCNVLRVCLEARVKSAPPLTIATAAESLVDTVARLAPEIATGIHNAVNGSQVSIILFLFSICNICVCVCFFFQKKKVESCQSCLASTSNNNNCIKMNN